ncbi:hypothetical protein LOTGIDRAFT_173469 [Lottia gigantea]|uniref:PKD domain-containing protein n=1 Tax=Lottia gigantea TaxID=225164 RepID=V4A7F8_LOTGI|nr:hypothetical protein LOTGIDRAFT_173469 [Lottia gigantea]ESO99868.1 hypothetical protein LOTGIDRAFT_173469 [Lottia gigantea]
METEGWFAGLKTHRRKKGTADPGSRGEDSDGVEGEDESESEKRRGVPSLRERLPMSAGLGVGELRARLGVWFGSVVALDGAEKGSHMMFAFEFGDGGTETKYVEFISDPMMQLITAKHRYQNEGVYQVKLIVQNPLGNLTVSLDKPFYVQVPPDGIELFGSLCILPRQDLHLTLEVAMGTNITINWKMGDETEFIDHGKSVTHQYQTTGTKFLEVIVYNRVDRVHLPREITVVDEIHGATLKIPSVVIIAGQRYTYNVTARPNIDGIVQYYEWDSNSTLPRGSEITKDSFNTFALPSGKHMLTVTATNCLSKAISKPVNVHSVAQLVDLSIMAVKNKLVGKPVEFQAKFWDGDYLNFTWDFGDGHHKFVVGQVNVNHTYKHIGEYTVRLTAANPISSMATHYQVFILDQICNPPDVSIVKPSRRLNKLTFRKCEVLYIEAQVQVKECELSSVVQYSWTILDIRTNHPVFPKYPDDPVFRSSSLILPSHTLHYGNYTVKLKVRMKGTIVYSMSKIQLEVIPSPLKVTIDGGKYRRFNHKDILILNGSLSQDLDQHSNLSYKWSCVVLSSNKWCFENSTWPPNIQKDVAVVTMPIQLLRKDKSDFLFNLTVSTSSGRNASTEQVIKVLKIDQVLSLKISCKQCIGELVNPSNQVSFETSCTGCVPTETRYKWEVKLVVGKQQPQSAVHDFGQCVQPDGSSYDLKFLSQKLGTTKEPPETTSQRVSEKVTTSLPIFGPWMMNEGQSGRGSYGRGGMVESRMTEGQRSPPLPETFRGSKLNEGLPFPVRSQLRNLPRHHDANDILTIPREGSPGESGSSQGRNIGTGTNVHNPIEQPGLGRQFEDKPGHRTSNSENTDRVLGRPTPRNETKHVFSQDSTTVRLLPTQTKTGLNKQSLVIKADVLMQGRTYVVKVTAHSRDNITGVAMMYFIVNKSPQKGLCEVSSRYDGVELETNFKVFCREWKDEHMPLKFEVSYNLYKEDMKKLLYRGLSHEINFKLPAGNTTDQNRVYLFIGILDGIEARTSVCPIPIQVRPRDITYNYTSFDELLYSQVEILQVAQSLVSTTEVPSELTKTSLLKALEVLQSLYEETESLSTNLKTGFPDLLTLAVRAVSNIMQAVLQSPLTPNNRGLKMVTSEALRVVDSLVKLELRHHSIGEEPIKRMAEFVSVIATHFLTGQKQKIEIKDASFIIPKVTANDTDSCYQAHMTTFTQNPFGYNERYSSKIQSQVVSLDIYSCQGRQPVIQNLDDDNLVEIWIPRNKKEPDSSSQHLLKRSVMNVHQFNITKENLDLSLFITLELNLIQNGRPFPLAVLIGSRVCDGNELLLLYFEKGELFFLIYTDLG